MRIQKIQNNNYTQFQGLLRVQNFKKGGEVIERVTTEEFDKGLAECAFKNIFKGNWSDTGHKFIQNSNLAGYGSVLRHTLGINLPKTDRKIEQVILGHSDNSYSIKIQGLLERQTSENKRTA